MFGALGYSGFVNQGGTGGGGGGNTYSPIVKTAGVGDGPTVGSSTYTNSALIGAVGLVFIIVNNAAETIGVDFNFNPITGTISNINNNKWQLGDELVVPYATA
jgi:hypothetical protein